MMVETVEDGIIVSPPSSFFVAQVMLFRGALLIVSETLMPLREYLSSRAVLSLDKYTTSGVVVAEERHNSLLLTNAFMKMLNREQLALIAASDVRYSEHFSTLVALAFYVVYMPWWGV